MKSAYERHFNLIVVCLTLGFLAINFDVLLDLYYKWNPSDYAGPFSHGPLVAVIVLYLVYQEIRNNHHEFYPKTTILGMVALLGFQIIFFLAKIIGVNFVQHITLVLSLLSVVWAAYSFNTAKRFILPAMLFFLSFPVWMSAEYPLQKISIFTTNFVLDLTNISYYRQGPFFHFSSGIIEIAPECAGLQQLLVSLILGLLFSVRNKLGTRDVIKTLIYLSIVAIIINTIRIIIIMIVGYYTKMESSLITKHVMLGWIIYGIGIYAFLYFYSGFKFKPVMNKDATKGSGGFTAISRQHVMIFGLAAALLIMLPSVLYYAVERYINHQPLKSVHFRVDSDTWHKNLNQVSIDWRPQFPKADSQVVTSYSKNGKSIYLYVYNYTRIAEGVEPINMSNVPYNRDEWSIQRRTELFVPQTDGPPKAVRLEYLTSTSGTRMLVLFYYIVNGKIVDSLSEAKLASLAGLMKLHYDIKVVCLATLQSTVIGKGDEIMLSQFLQSLRIY